MRLSEKEYYQYLDIHPKLMYDIGKRKKLLPSNTTIEEFMNYAVEDKYPIRNALYEHIDLVEDYISENAKDLTAEEIAIIRAFKNFRKGSFYVVKLTKKYALFLGEEYVYGVHALSDPFQMFWGDHTPVMVEAVLLPYKGKIIYDGIISTYPIHLGKNIKDSIKNEYTLLEGKYGIITTLPENIDKEKLDNSLEKELLLMMKTKSSRDHYWYEIENLLKENPKLEYLYIKEWGRINSRKKKKELKRIGIKKQYFAMYEDTIITSAASQKDVEHKVKDLISDNTIRKSIYYFGL